MGKYLHNVIHILIENSKSLSIIVTCKMCVENKLYQVERSLHDTLVKASIKDDFP